MSKHQHNEVVDAEEVDTALVPVQAGGELATFGLTDFLADEGLGNENVKASDIQIPFLKLLQKMSPEVDDSDSKFIDGAKPGQFINSVTTELLDGKNGVLITPCYYSKEIVEWKPKNSGGGIAARHSADSNILSQAKPGEDGKGLFLANGNAVKETAYHYVLVLKPGNNTEWAILGLTSTQLKKSKKLNTLINGLKLTANGRQFTPPRFAQVYRMTSVDEEKPDGKFKNFEFEYVGTVQNREVYEAAKFYNDAAKQLAGRVALPEESAEGSSKEDVPF